MKYNVLDVIVICVLLDDVFVRFIEGDCKEIFELYVLSNNHLGQPIFRTPPLISKLIAFCGNCAEIIQ